MGKEGKGLLAVPLEIRHIIYRHLFQSTTVRRGFKQANSNHTAILTACKQIHDEAKPLLAHNVFLHFRATVEMLNDLFTYDDQRIKSIRRLRVKGYPFPAYPYPDSSESISWSYTTYFFDCVISMFPGLQLDLFVIDNCFLEDNDGWGSSGTYSEITGLSTTNGWKELHYIAPTTEFLTDNRMGSDDDVHAQPERWQLSLQKRDEQASVEMFVAKEKDIKDAAYNVETRTKFSYPGQNMPIPPPIDLPSDRGEHHKVSIDSREVLVVMKRGPEAPYVQDGKTLHEPLRVLLSKMSWPELRDSGLFLNAEDSPCDHL